MSVADKKKTDWVEVAKLDDIPKQGSRTVKTEAGDIAIFRSVNDELFALKDECPHKGGPISQGVVFGCKVACPLHNWKIELSTGKAAPPDEGSVTTYPIKLEGESVFISGF